MYLFFLIKLNFLMKVKFILNSSNQKPQAQFTSLISFIIFIISATMSINFCGRKENYFTLQGVVLYGNEPVISAEVGIVGSPPQKTDIYGRYKFRLGKGRYLIYAKKENLAFSGEVEIKKGDKVFDIKITEGAKVWGRAFFRGHPKLVGVAFLPFFAPVKEDGGYTLYAPYGKHKIIFSELIRPGIIINFVDVVITGETVLNEPFSQKYEAIICPSDEFLWGNQFASFRFVTQNWFIFNFPCSISSEFKYDIPFNPDDLDLDTIQNEKDFDADGDSYDNDFEVKRGTDPLSAISFPTATIRIKAISEDGTGGVIIYAGDDIFVVSEESGLANLIVPLYKPINIYAMKPGFFSEHITDFVPSDENSPLEIVLMQGVMILGKVFDTRGNPLPGAKVIVGEKEQITDDKGEFMVVAKKYPYGITLEVQKEGFFPFFDLINTDNVNLNLKVFLCRENEKDCILSYMLSSLKKDLSISIKYLDEFEKRFGRQPESNIIGIIIDVKSIFGGINLGLDFIEILHSKLSDIYERAQDASWTTTEKIDLIIASGYFGQAEANFISAITRLIYLATKYITSHNLDFKEKLREIFKTVPEPEQAVKIIPSAFSDKSLLFKDSNQQDEILSFLRENFEKAKIELQNSYHNSPECPSERFVCKDAENKKIYFAQIPFDYEKTIDFFERAKSEFIDVAEIMNFLPIPEFVLPLTFIKINLSIFITKPLREYLPEVVTLPTDEGPIPAFQVDFEKEDEDSEHFRILKKDGITGGIYVKFKDPTFSGSLILEKCIALNFALKEKIHNEIQAECGWKNPTLQDLNDVLAIIQKALKKERNLNLLNFITLFLMGNNNK